MFGTIFTGLIFGVCAFLMFGIGIFQLKSKKPVTFYAGEEPPREEQLTDMSKWNKKHGIMWIIYGICIVASWICALLVGDNIYAIVPLCIGVFIPLPFMVMYHHALIKRYFINFVNGT